MEKESFPKINIPTDTRDVGLIVGPSGVGKTYYMVEYAKQYVKANKAGKPKVILFSNSPDDAKLVAIPKLVKINMEEFANPEVDLEELKKDKEFSNSLVIFDDTEAIINPNLRKKVHELMMDLLVTGRHTNTGVLVIAHVLAGKQRDLTRAMITEAKWITTFPASGQVHQTKQLLEKHLGLDPRAVREILALPSRWVTIYCRYPQNLLCEIGECDLSRS